MNTSFAHVGSIKSVDDVINIDRTLLSETFLGLMAQRAGCDRLIVVLGSKKAVKPLDENESSKLDCAYQRRSELDIIISAVENSMTQLVSNPEDKYLHIGKREFVCDYCGSVVKGPVFYRYHDKKCKKYTESVAKVTNVKSDCIV